MNLFFWRHNVCEKEAALKAQEAARVSLIQAHVKNAEVTELNKQLIHLRQSNGFVEVIEELFERRKGGGRDL